MDAETDLENEAHILRKGDSFYNVFLIKVDVEKDKNSFYNLQLLESDHDNDHYWVFRSWGRISLDGEAKLEKYDKEEAINEFKSLYALKTNNQWEDRKKFCKKPSFYFLMDVDYSKLDNKFDISISKTQLQKAISTLNEVASFFKENSKNLNKIYAAMNKFYSLVPHNFGSQPIELIKSTDITPKRQTLAFMNSKLSCSTMRGNGEEEEVESEDSRDY